MTNKEWNDICNSVTEQMRFHTQPFVTPLIYNKTLVGSGNYIILDNETYIATCQHVSVHGKLDYRFYGSDKEFNSHDAWIMQQPPTDLAIAPLLCDQMTGENHRAQAVPYDKFAKSHAPHDSYEILFFRGYSGENASTFGGCCEANASAYCTQEKTSSGNTEYFELLWEPGKAQYTTATTDEEREKVKFENPKGFSGSLVWNTRYREVSAAERSWTPKDAVVTGMAHRWDCKTKTLLVYRVEHIRQFIGENLASSSE